METASRSNRVTPPLTTTRDGKGQLVTAQRQRSGRGGSNEISLSAIAAAQREQASMQRRAPAPVVVVNPVRTGLVSRLMFVDAMRRPLGRIAPRPAVVHHETHIINQTPVVIGGSMSREPVYYDEWDYPLDEYEYYEGYYNEGEYLEDFGYTYDEYGNLYISPHEQYDPLLSGYYTDEGYVAPPAYLVGPGIELETYYPMAGRYGGGYGLRGLMHGWLRSWLTPYHYHRTVYYWNRMGNYVQAENSFRVTLSLLLPLGLL